MAFYNTVNEKGEKLRELRSSADSQEKRILDFFRKNPRILVTAEEVHKATETGGPLTSTRRAISNLHKSGEIVKTLKKRPGSYGIQIYCWIYYPHNPEQIKIDYDQRR